MAEATLKEINNRIIEIDELIFRGSTGQMAMTTGERDRLDFEATSLVETLTNALVKSGAGDYNTLYEKRNKLRQVSLIVAAHERYLAMHPEPDPEIDSFYAALAETTDNTLMREEALEKIAAILKTVYVPMADDKPSGQPKRNS